MPSATDYLISNQHESGGWGYLPGHSPVVEPTAVVLLALRADPKAQVAFERGISWLLKCQHSDGGWGINEKDPESGWQTAWALIALKTANQNEDSIAKAQQWLQSVGTLEFTAQQFLNPDSLQNGRLTSLVWPWWPGQAGWIEPTALAVLALADKLDNPAVAARIQAAHDYFRKYRTPDGGWNIGNTTSVDTIVVPRAYPTTLVLLAMSHSASEDILPSDISALQQDMSRDTGMLAKGAGLLALRVTGGSDEAMISFLTDHQVSDGS